MNCAEGRPARPVQQFEFGKLLVVQPGERGTHCSGVSSNFVEMASTSTGLTSIEPLK